MKDKRLYELGILAQEGNEEAMLEIINRKKPLLKKYSYGDEDIYQMMLVRVIESVKKFNFKKS